MPSGNKCEYNPHIEKLPPSAPKRNVQIPIVVISETNMSELETGLQEKFKA